jgi:hypothetical protein
VSRPQDKPVDIISARVVQARAVLTAVSLTYDHERKEYNVTPKVMNGALWGLDELLAQLEDASEQLIADGQL